MSSLVRKVSVNERGSKKRKLSSTSSSSSRGMAIRRPLSGMKGLYRFSRYSQPIYLTYQNSNGFFNTAGTTAQGTSLGFYWSLQGTGMINSTGLTIYTMSNNTEFQNLFDRFKIDSVDMTIIHAAENTGSVTGIAAAQVPTYYICYDPNSAGQFGSISEALERDCVVWKPSSTNPIFKKRYYPYVLADGTIVGTVPEMPRGTFVPTASTTSRFHGVRLIADAMGQTGTTVFTPLTVQFKYNMSFKTVQ